MYYFTEKPCSIKIVSFVTTAEEYLIRNPNDRGRINAEIFENPIHYMMDYKLVYCIDNPLIVEWLKIRHIEFTEQVFKTPIPKDRHGGIIFKSKEDALYLKLVWG